MLNLILAEAALETVPQKLCKHPAVRRNAKKQKKQPQQTILDRTLHHAAMLKLPDAAKRGRPDITHFTLLEALGSPLNKEGLLRVFVHTINNQVITVNPESRLPRNYNRFIGLMEQLFEQQKVPQEGEPLLVLEQKTLQQLLKQINPDHVLAFSTAGKPKTLQDAVFGFQPKTNPAVIIGAFPHGHFTEATLKLVDELVCVDPEMLDAWTVASRVVYEYERLFSIPKKRLATPDQ